MAKVDEALDREWSQMGVVEVVFGDFVHGLETIRVVTVGNRRGQKEADKSSELVNSFWARDVPLKESTVLLTGSKVTKASPLENSEHALIHCERAGGKEGADLFLDRLFCDSICICFLGFFLGRVCEYELCYDI